MSIHQPITRDEAEAFEGVFLEAVPIVQALADERAKRWPKLFVHQQRHQIQIETLQAELTRVAGRIDWTKEYLETIVRAEIKRRGRYVPRVVALPVQDSDEQRAADTAALIASDICKNTERLIKMHQDNLIKQHRDLATKRETARAIREGRAFK